MALVVQIVHAKKSEMGRGKGTYLLLVTISFQFQLPQISSLFQTSIFLVINVAGRVAWRYRFWGFLRPSLFIIIYFIIIHRPSLLSFPVLSSPSFSLPLLSLDRNQAAKLLCLLANVFCNMLKLSLSLDFLFNNRILQLVVANWVSTEGCTVGLWWFTCSTLLGICTVSFSLLKTLCGMSPQLQLDISRNKRGCK